MSPEQPSSAVVPPEAPLPRGSYSPGLLSGDLVYVSGQASVDPRTQEVVLGTIEDETARTLDNIEALLAAAGCGWGNVLKATVHLADLDDFAAFDRIYQSRLSEPFPARTTVASGLPGIKVEIDVVARRSGVGELVATTTSLTCDASIDARVLMPGALVADRAGGGPAFPVRLIPAPDGGTRSWYAGLTGDLAGRVLVIDATDVIAGAVWDCDADAWAAARGLAGVVIAGAVRGTGSGRVPFAGSARDPRGALVSVQATDEVRIAGETVASGAEVVFDGDGVVVVPLVDASTLRNKATDQ